MESADTAKRTKIYGHRLAVGSSYGWQVSAGMNCIMHRKGREKSETGYSVVSSMWAGLSLNRAASALLTPLKLRPGWAVLARLILVGLLALMIRLAFVLDFVGQPLFDANLARGTDMEFLIGWARRIAGGDLLGRGTGPFWWAPLYPYTLGGILAVLGRDNLMAAAIVQAVLGALTCSLVYLMGRGLLDEATGLVAGLLVAVYGPAIFYVGIFLSTTLEVFLAVAIVLTVTVARARPTPRRWLGAGIMMGLGCLARPNFLVPTALLGALLPVMLHRSGAGPRWPTVRRAGLAFALGLVVTIAPVTLRNLAVGGQPILVSAAGPETFRIANSYDSTPMNFVYPKKPLMPITSSAFWRHQLRKALLFWWGFEAPQNINYYLVREFSPTLRLAWFPFWLAAPLAVVGLWATRRHAEALAQVYVLLSGYYLSIVPFFIIARWRLPFVVPLLLFTAAGLVALYRWAAARQWRAVTAGAAAATMLALIIRPGSGPFIFAADHGQLGYILANRGEYAEAVIHMAQAATGLPDNGFLHRDLGFLLHRLGRMTEARAALERAAVLIPNDALSHLYLGRLLLASGGDPRQAYAHLDRALRLAPDGPTAAQARALLKSPRLERRLP